MQAVTFIFAFVAVLALIVVAAWLVRRFASNRLGTNTSRGRMPRLAVIDAAAVDGRRRLVLVRRDNIEHLLMIGGPTDIVVESNIVRATANRDQLPQRPSAVESPPRIAPLPDAGIWAEAEAVRSDDHVPLHVPAQMPEPPPRPMRPAFADDLRRPAPVMTERRADPLTGFGPDQLNFRPEPRPEPRLEPRPEPRSDPRNDPRTEPRPEPRAEVRPEPTPPRMPRIDAEAIPPRMPRGEPMPRSEAMPRSEPMPRNEQMPRGEPMMPRPARPGEPPKMPPMRAPERAIVPPPSPPPPAPPPSNNANADQNLAEMAQRLEAALRRPGAEPMAPPAAPEPAPTRVAMRSEPPLAPAPPAPPPKSSFENLEDEMASLLGRPKSSSSS
jgi:flagellar protein FliO/FliZ